MKHKNLSTNIDSAVAAAVRFFLDAHRAESGRGILVAVSGGMDSTALFDALVTNGIRTAVAHCNFQLRGDASDADETFVREMAAARNVPFFNARFDTHAVAASQKISIQEAARSLRYDWLDAVRKENGFAFVATAHHADDNAETILQHIVNGTGLAGLRGIPAVNGRIVRPLLPVTKAQIEQYIAERKLPFRTDSSNASTKYTRNKIRLALLPILRELNPLVVKTLNENATRWQQAYGIYKKAVDKSVANLATRRGALVTVNIAALQAQTSAQTVLFEWLKPFAFNATQAEEIFESLSRESGKTFFSATHRLIKDRKHLILAPVAAVAFDHTIDKGSGTFALPGGKLSIETLTKASEINFNNATYQYISADDLQFPLSLRPWRKGDYFYPFGLNKKKKLSDYFTNNKLSLIEKERQPVLLSGDRVVAVPGLTIDHRFRVTPSTRQVLKIRFVKNN